MDNEKIKVDLEYRWFLGIPLGKKTPHYSTFSQNYIRRFTEYGWRKNALCT